MVRGGKRTGAGRRPQRGATSASVTTRLTPDELAEILSGLGDGETLSAVLRDGALALVRSRARDP